MNTSPTGKAPYLRRLLLPEVWRRAAPIGLGVGLLQICVNQGDYWLHAQVTTSVLVKTILCPLISLGVAVASAAAAHQGEV